MSLHEKDDAGVEYREPIGQGYSLLLRRDALPLGTDALLLAGILPNAPQASALEIGAGCGTVSLLAAVRQKFCRIDAVEINPVLAELAARNAKENGLTDRLRVYTADIRRFSSERLYDVIFINPPYRAAGSGRPCKSPLADISRYERAGTLRELFAAAARLLSPNGALFYVYPAARRSALNEALSFAALSRSAETAVAAHKGAAPTLLLGWASHGQPHAPSVTLPPLFLHEDAENRVETDAMKTLYETGNLPVEWSYHA